MGKMIEFHEGETAEATGIPNADYRAYNGMRCVVVKGLGSHEAERVDKVKTVTPNSYVVKFPDGVLMCLKREQLTLPIPRSRADLDTPVRWNDCAWQPTPQGIALAERTKKGNKNGDY